MSYFDSKLIKTYSNMWNDCDNRLRFTVGCPHSGKSTWANKWQKSSICPYHLGNRVIISGDDFRLASSKKPYLHNNKNLIGSSFDSFIPLTTTLTASMFLAIKALLLNKQITILFDETNSSERSINYIFNIDPQAQYIRFHTHPDICKERAIKNTKLKRQYIKGLLIAINKIANNLEKLNIEKIREKYL